MPVMRHLITQQVYYDPLEQRLKKLREKYKDNAKALDLIEQGPEMVWVSFLCFTKRIVMAK